MHSSCCRRRLICFILIIYSLLLMDFGNSESPKEVFAKECEGSHTGLMHSTANSTQRYESYRRKYENCTRVRNNLEIVFIGLTDEKYDFAFLENIREVGGYVLIYGNLVSRIRLTRLRVIRGIVLYKSTEEGREQEFSLYVGMNSKKNNNSKGLQELHMPSLVEILDGKVLFKGNSRLCFGEKTIDWNHILLNNKIKQKSVLHLNETGYEKIECQSVCHENCPPAEDGLKYCWGRERDTCQQFRKCGNCGPREKCYSQCIAGCDQPEQCRSCRNYARLSDPPECIKSCSEDILEQTPSGEIPVQITDRYAQGSKCVTECEVGFVAQGYNCVVSCITGYMVNGTQCVKCPGECPDICKGTAGEWIIREELPQFARCKKVVGNLIISESSFSGHNGIMNQTISVEDLEILSSIEEITGYLVIGITKHSEFTSLKFLRNLTRINGAEISEDDCSLSIAETPLQSLDLKSLQWVANCIHIEDNHNLCFADRVNWNTITNGGVYVGNNKNSSFCEDECSPLCLPSNGCMGPESDSCITCRHFQLIDGYNCSSNCFTENGFYVSQRLRGNRQCRPCSEQCDGSCSGDGPEHCYKCKHFNHSGVCVVKCPSQTYVDPDRVCQQCNSVCNGCTGNSSVLGPSGCNSCINNMIRYDNETHEQCISSVDECDESRYYMHSPKACRRCHPECIGCSGGSGASNCKKCRHFVQNQTTEGDPECVSDCSEYFYDAKNGECRPCHPECPRCFGQTAYDCYSCRNVRIYDGDSSLESIGDFHNDTQHRSYCAEDCPAGQKREKGNATDSTCKAIDESWKTAIVPVFVILFLIIVVGLVIFILFWRKQRTKRVEEELLIDLMPSKAKPNMASLRLIKESELRRGNTIGSGAFGTVYKGIWIPERENVKIPVAIKVLQDTSNTSQNMELLDEACIMASVCHPYCVRILAVCMTAQMMLVTQLMPLGCLLDYVRKERANIGSRVLLLWSVQIAKGMKYLEELGIVHRDLAARNVLVYNSNHVKITDFGLAKILDYDKEEIHSEGGKMPIKWLALECIQHRIYTHKSDVWSYGVTLWEMFTYGSRPYENLQARHIPQALEKGERLPQPPICTLDVYMTLIKCWMLDTDSRPTFSDLVEEFSRMAADPGRFLVIQGDTLMRLPSQAPDARDLFRLMSLPVDDEPHLTIMSGEEYLKPMGLDFEGSDGLFSPTSSTCGRLMSIPEDVGYENSEMMERRRLQSLEDDLVDGKSHGKLSQQFSRERSQRYISDPCRTGDAEGKEDDKLSHNSQIFRVDKDGYIPPQSVTDQPSYLELVYQPTDQNSEQPNQTPPPKHYLEMKSSVGIAKNNFEYFDDEESSLTNDKLHAKVNSEKTTKTQEEEPEYCNEASTFTDLPHTYNGLPQTDL